MGARIWIRKGTGNQCWICKEKITKDQVQINFSGYNASAIIHSEPVDCNMSRRTQVPNK